MAEWYIRGSSSSHQLITLDSDSFPPLLIRFDDGLDDGLVDGLDDGLVDGLDDGLDDGHGHQGESELNEKW